MSHIKSFFKAWFYRKGRFFPPYLYMSLFLFAGLAIIVCRLIPNLQRELQIDNTLIGIIVPVVMTWVGIWSWAVTKDSGTTIVSTLSSTWDGIERRVNQAAKDISDLTIPK